MSLPMTTSCKDKNTNSSPIRPGKDPAQPTSTTQQLITVSATSASFPTAEHAKLILVSEPSCLLPLDSEILLQSFHKWSLLTQTMETFLYYFPLKLLDDCPFSTLNLIPTPLPILVYYTYHNLQLSHLFA